MSVRVLFVATHPSQYGTPLFRRYAEHPGLDLTVAYLSLRGAERAHDPGFGREIEWDVPLLEGYEWISPPDWSPLDRPGSLWDAVNPALWSHIRDGSYEVVVCQGYRRVSLWIAGLAARLVDAAVAVVTDAHTLEPHDGRRWKLPLKRVLVPRILSCADGVLTLSRRGSSFLLELGLTPEKVHLVPYVVDNGFFRDRAADADREATRRSWEVGRDASVVLFCGKLIPQKRPQDAVRAIARTRDVHLVVAGDGSLRRELEALANRLGVTERVRFLGFVNQTELPGVYAAADALVLTSGHEAFGLVVNEAFACGTPAVVTDACGAADDLIVEGETGCVVDVGDVGTLARRLRWITTPTVSSRLGATAQARIDEWGPEQNVAAMVRACRSLAGREPDHRTGGGRGVSRTAATGTTGDSA